MSSVLQFGDQLIRISPEDSKVLEFSTNGGQNWFPKEYKGKRLGNFKEIYLKKWTIVAVTDIGKRWSDNGGKSWYGGFLRFWVVFFRVLGPFMKSTSGGRGAAGRF